jgi:hypothetical protein
MNRVILLQWTQSFFTTTVLSHSSSYSTQSFFVATLLSHFPLLITQSFLLLQCSAIFTTTVFNHSSCKRSSIIHRCYSTQPFSTIKKYSIILQSYSTQSLFATTLLSHYSLLQCVRPLRHFAKWPSSVTVVGARGREPAWSWACTEVTRDSVVGVQSSRSRGGMGSSHTRRAPDTVVPYIYIYM